MSDKSRRKVWRYRSPYKYIGCHTQGDGQVIYTFERPMAGNAGYVEQVNCTAEWFWGKR